MNPMIESVKFNASGLVTAIVQDAATGEVLMCAYMNREALEKTLAENRCWYFSRSRNKLWLKGESSGHIQTVKDIRIDCDGDALLFRVEQAGGACHTGYRSCFYRRMSTAASGEPWDIVSEKIFDPGKIYGK